MRKISDIHGGGVLGTVGAICLLTVLLWIVFYVAIPVTLLLMGILGDWIGAPTDAWDVDAKIFQPSIFAASLICATILVLWDKGIQAHCRDGELKRRDLLIRFLELEHGLSISDDRKAEIFAGLDAERD